MEGSYTCSCNSGFHGEGTSCSDINECVWGVHDCHRKAKCFNTAGSYRCSCLNGYHGNGKDCKGKQVIQVQLRYLMECVHCHAIKNKIKNRASDSHEIVILETINKDDSRWQFSKFKVFAFSQSWDIGRNVLLKVLEPGIEPPYCWTSFVRQYGGRKRV